MRTSVVLLGAALALSGCSVGGAAPGGPPTVSVQPVETTTTATATTGVDRPIDAAEHVLPPTIRTLALPGARFGLTGVQRLADDVVVVVGVLTPSDGFVPSDLTEPAHVRPGGGGDLSDLTVTVPGDDRKFIPLRTERGDCLCSPLRPEAMTGPMPVYALVGIPADAEVVALAVADGTVLENIEIEDLPTDVSRSPLGPSHNVEVLQARRFEGRLTVRTRVENPSRDSTRLPRGLFDPTHLADLGPCFRGLSVVASDGRTVGITRETDCDRGYLPTAGRFVDLTLTTGDPGGTGLVFLPTLGTPLVGLPVVGFGERGERDVVVGLDRYRVGEVEVVTGPRPRLHIPLDRLMAGAQLEEGADPILASVVAQTEGASVPRLALTVHSGGTQGAGDQLATTVAQSAVLVEELQRRLGADWTVTGTGVGGSSPLVAVRGTGLDAALVAGLNARVEIRIGGGSSAR